MQFALRTVVLVRLYRLCENKKTKLLQGENTQLTKENGVNLCIEFKGDYMRMRIKKKKDKQNTGVLPDVPDAVLEDGNSEQDSALKTMETDSPETLASDEKSDNTEGNEKHEKIQAESAIDLSESEEVPAASDSGSAVTDNAENDAAMLELDSDATAESPSVSQENVVPEELNSAEKEVVPATKTEETPNDFYDFDLDADYSNESSDSMPIVRNADPVMAIMDEPYPYVGATSVPIVDTVDGATLYVPIERISNPEALFKPRQSEQLPYEDETIVYEKEYGKFEVIAGGYIRCRVIDATDQDDAKLMQLDYAQKKYQLSHMERIQAYANELAIYLASGDNEDEAVNKIADLNGVHVDTVEAYLQLNKLLPQLMTKIDKGITIAGAEILAKMSEEDQQTVIDTMQDLSLPFLSAGQIREIEKVSQKRNVTVKDIAEITEADAITITKQQFEDAVYEAVNKVLKQVEKH